MTQNTEPLTIAQLRSLANGSDTAAPTTQALHTSQTDIYSQPATYAHKQPYADAQSNAAVNDPRQVGVTRGDTWEAPNWLVHVHKYWHRYIAVMMGLLVLGVGIFSSHVNISIGIALFAGVLLGLKTWLVLASIRGKLQNTANMTTLSQKSPVFKFGAALGLAYYLYSNGLPELTLPNTLDRETLKPILLGTIIFMAEVYGGGKLLVFISKKFFGYDPEEDESQDDNIWRSSDQSSTRYV